MPDKNNVAGCVGYDAWSAFAEVDDPGMIFHKPFNSKDLGESG